MLKKILRCLVWWVITFTAFHGGTAFVKLCTKYELECGEVTSNFTQIKNIKHGTKTEYFLKIKFKNETKVKCVDAETYYKYYDIGSKICFKKYSEPTLYLLLGILFLGAMLFMTFCSIFFLIFDDITASEAFFPLIYIYKTLIFK